MGWPAQTPCLPIGIRRRLRVSYTFNQYTVYGPGGPAAVNPLGAGIAVPLSQVQVSCDIFVSGYTNPANQIQIDYQSNIASGTTDSIFRSTLTNNAYKHIVFTL